MQMKIKDLKKNLFMLKIIVFDVPKKTVLNIFLLKLLFFWQKNGSSAQEIPTSRHIWFLKLRKVSCVLKAEKSNLYENDAIYCWRQWRQKLIADAFKKNRNNSWSPGACSGIFRFGYPYNIDCSLEVRPGV